MNKARVLWAIRPLLILLGTLPASFAQPHPAPAPAAEESVYIVTCRRDANVEEVCGEHNLQAGLRYRHALNGFAARLNPRQAERLRRDGRVKAVVPNVPVQFCAQTNSWAIPRLGLDRFPVARINGFDERIEVDVAVLDSGIETNHPDLNVYRAASFVEPGVANVDWHGHGTAVAGVIGALDNDIGVVGVAPGVRLWSVQIIGASQNTVVEMLAGMDYVAEHADEIEVVNCSFMFDRLCETSTEWLRAVTQEAISNLVSRGVVVVAASGNNSAALEGCDGVFGTPDDQLPGGLAEVMAVSAFDPNRSGLWGRSGSSGTNHPNAFVNSPGGGIDVVAPGVDIITTGRGGILDGPANGTSYSCAHVSGLVALYIAAHGRAHDAAGVYRIRQAIVDTAIPQTDPSQWNTNQTFDFDGFPEPLARPHPSWMPGPWPKLEWIAPGRFTMGSPASEPGHVSAEEPPTQMTLTRGFWMANYEVTQGEYLSLMNTNPSAFPGDTNLPVETVSWAEAVEYCRRLTQQEAAAGRVPADHAYRLPTEAEWEYACRAGTTTPWSFGTNATDLDAHGWHLGNATNRTQGVGRKFPNAWGLYDIHGNVWEMTDSWQASHPGGAVMDWPGPPIGTLKTLRGGSYANNETGCRSAFRGGILPENDRHPFVGFRVVLAPVAEEPSNLVWIPPGQFRMGSPPAEVGHTLAEEPPTWVTLTRGFWMGRYEVTQGEYLSVMNTNPSAFPGDLRRPVEMVSWQDAVLYCDRRTERERAAGILPAGYAYRLPTEAEWEYACRAGTSTRFHYDDDPGYALQTNHAWQAFNSGGTTHPIGQKPGNPWGLHDMIGNVQEFTLDWFGGYLGNGVLDPAGPPAGSHRVTRGGDWNDFDEALRSAVRFSILPSERFNQQGFRVVLAEERPRRTIFATGFEALEGYAAGQAWIGQQGWARGNWSGQLPSGGQGIGTNLLAGSPQQAFIGGMPGATVPGVHAAVGRTLTYPAAVPGEVEFAWTQSITDSTNGARNNFEWLFYETSGAFLCGILFANDTRVIWLRNSDNSVIDSGLRFERGQNCAISLRLDFARNLWALRVDTNVLAPRTLAVSGPALGLGSFHLLWMSTAAQAPLPGGPAAGDNRLVFDDLRVTAPTPEPGATALGLVSVGSVWKYLDNGSNPGTNWVAPSFDDTAWASGPAQLGFGDSDEATLINGGPANARFPTTYFRRAFTATNIWAITNLSLGLLRDDGAIVYLNGVEVFRSNMPTGAVNHLTVAPTFAADDGTSFLTTTINPSLLVEGANVMAVEVHQNNATSSDLSFDLYLHAELARCHPALLALTNAGGVFTFDVETASVLEGPRTAVFNVRRLGATNVQATANFQTVNGTALWGIDYAQNNGPLFFQPGEVLKQIGVFVGPGEGRHDDRTLYLRLVGATANASLSPCTNIAITIFDDDGVFELVQTNAVIPEVTAWHPVTIRWTGASNRVASVRFRTENGTATGNGADYYSWDTRLTFAPGQRETTVSIRVSEDTLVENDETFRVFLSEPGEPGAGLGTASNLTVQILDNDALSNPGRGANDFIETILVQPDGRSVLAGNLTAFNGVERAAPTLVRVRTNGLRDTSFAMPQFNGSVLKLAQQADGKILAGGGFALVDSTPRGRLARFHTNGMLDATFAVTNGANFGVTEIVALPDGRVLIGGDFTVFDGVPRRHVARLNTNGTLDTTFDPGASINSDWLFALNAQADGKVLIGGSFGFVQGQFKPMLARLEANGALDPTFNPGGTGPDSTVNFINVLPDGKLLIGGWFGNYNGTPRQRVARLFADGTLDPTFDPQWDPNVATTWNAALQSDGNIIVVGWQVSAGGQLPNYITRFLPNGQLDTSFRIGPGANGPVLDGGVLPDGRIVLGGYFNVLNGFNRARFAILNPDGTLPDDSLSWFQWSPGTGGNGHWYSFTRRPNNWTNAEAEAVAARGHLVSVNSAAEQSFLETTFLKGLNRIRPFWIGLNDTANEGSFVWSSGENFTYSNWESGQPDNANGVEDFVALNWYFSWNGAAPPYRFGAWNDIPLAGYVSQTVSGGDSPYFGIIETTNNPFAPFIMQQPQSLVVNGGSNATLAVAASVVTGTLSHQWRLHGTNLPGATNATLALPGVQPHHAGPYSVVLTANGNSVTSATATLRAVWVHINADGRWQPGPAYAHEGPSQITLESVYPGGLVYYTLDGATPDFLNGTPYFGPFGVSQSATLRTATYDAGFAGFAEEQPLQLTILPGLRIFATTAGGGSVGASPNSPFHARDAVVTLTAAAAPNWTFLGWAGDAAGTNPVTAVVMTRDLRVQAVFGTPLNVTVVPPGSGSVIRAPDLPIYPFGASVQMAAQPAPGNHFFLWGGLSNSTNTPQAVSITTAPRNVSALFSNLPPGEVALVLNALGNGRLTNSPRGNRFPAGAVVLLTALPDAGQDFIGWSGDVSGTNNPLTLTLDASKTVTGSFTRRPRLAAAGETSLSGQTAVRLTVQGEMGERYEVLTSEDFHLWEPLVTMTNQFGAVQTVETAATNRTQRVFRARTLP